MTSETTGEPPTSPADRDRGPTFRQVLTEADITSLTPSEWAVRWRQQDAYVSTLERRLQLQEGDVAEVRLAAERIRAQLVESQQREKVLVRRLTAKEQETQEYACQLNELKAAQAPNASSLRSAVLDPAVNSMLQHLRSELQATRLKLEDTQNELSAWKFTPDSNTGKRLMAKCRLLYQENEELGRITSSGRVAKLESDLALQKSFSEEVRQSQNELDSFLADLDEDVEGMQSTILFLQHELKKAKEAAAALQKENHGLRGARANGDAGVLEAERTDSENEADRTGVKRARRGSVLSIDYTEDDALVLNANGDVAMSDNE